MTEVLESHADGFLKNQRPKKADTPADSSWKWIVPSPSLLSRNTRLGRDATLLARVFLGYFARSPLPPHPSSSSASFATLSSKAAKVSHYGLPPNRSTGRVEPWREECRGSFLTAPGSWDRGSRIEGEGPSVTIPGEEHEGLSFVGVTFSVLCSLFSPSS